MVLRLEDLSDDGSAFIDYGGVFNLSGRTAYLALCLIANAAQGHSIYDEDVITAEERDNVDAWLSQALVELSVPYTPQGNEVNEALYYDEFGQNVSFSTVAGTWRLLRYQTEARNDGCVLDHNIINGAFRLALGTYRVVASHALYSSGRGAIRLYNITQNVVAGVAAHGGSSAMASNTSSILFLDTEFVVTSEDDQYVLQMYASASNASGGGPPLNIGTENYGHVRFIKYG